MATLVLHILHEKLHKYINEKKMVKMENRCLAKFVGMSDLEKKTLQTHDQANSFTKENQWPWIGKYVVLLSCEIEQI